MNGVKGSLTPSEVWGRAPRFCSIFLEKGVLCVSRPIYRVLLFCFLFLLFVSPLDAASIEFDFNDFATSQDFAEAMKPKNRLSPLDPERHSALSANHLIQAVPLALPSGDLFRIMLVCGEVSEGGGMRNIQLLIVDDRKATARVIQRIKLGDGEAPEMLMSAGEDDSDDMMIRILRTGNNAECYVYGINRASGKLSETFRVNRALPERLKLDVKATMHADGAVDVLAKRPPHEETVRMSEALDALIEDEIYQPNGRPIPAIVNLKCVRNGWEGERLRKDGEAVLLEVGHSLVTLSNKQVVVATVTFKKDGNGKWAPVSLACEPFLPYRSF